MPKAKVCTLMRNRQDVFLEGIGRPAIELIKWKHQISSSSSSRVGWSLVALYFSLCALLFGEAEENLYFYWTMELEVVQLEMMGCAFSNMDSRIYRRTSIS